MRRVDLASAMIFSLPPFLTMHLSLLANKAAFVALVVTIVPISFFSSVSAFSGADPKPAGNCAPYNAADPANKDNYWWPPLDFGPKQTWTDQPAFMLNREFSGHAYELEAVELPVSHLTRLWMSTRLGGQRQFKLRIHTTDNEVPVARDFWLGITNCNTSIPFSSITKVEALERCLDKDVKACSARPFHEHP